MNKVRNKKRSFVKPDKIANDLSRAIKRDFGINDDATFDLHESIRSDDPMTFFAKRQSCELLKKYLPDEYDDKRLRRDAFSTFRATCLRLNNISFANVLNENFAVLNKARLLVHECLGSFDTAKFLLKCRHSNGVSIGVSYTDTSVEAKFAWPMSTTKRAKDLLDVLLRLDSDFLELVLARGLQCDEGWNIVRGSRATCVPKDASKHRMIAIEPTVNMFLQQGLMDLLVHSIESFFGVDFKKAQARHTTLAFLGSIDGLRATIDFSNASDCVLLDLVRYLLPPDWFYVLAAVRCDEMLVDNEWIHLPMFATMGNATTFPIETLCFLAIAHACCSTDSLPSYPLDTRITVFGDDCILPTPIAPDFIGCCMAVGFVVNKDKTFVDKSGFRESCGGDYFHGYNVRPFYLRRPTRTSKRFLEAWCYTIINSLIEKYISYFGENKWYYHQEAFKCVASYLKQLDVKVCVVPAYFPADAGIKLMNADWSKTPFCSLPARPLLYDIHGSVSFEFLRFQFLDQREREDDIRLWQWKRQIFGLTAAPVPVALRKLSSDLDNLDSPIKEKGRYVVSTKGLYPYGVKCQALSQYKTG